MNPGVIVEIRQKAAALPADGPPVVQRARQLAVQAAATVAAAVEIDPTLLEYDRAGRVFDLLGEVLRQLKPLGRQAVMELDRQRLVAADADPREIARLGKTNPRAPDELAALASRCPEIAGEIRAAALLDWNTPQRILERSERLLPEAWKLEDIADQLRRAVAASLDLSHPAPEAVRLARLADQITRERAGE